MENTTTYVTRNWLNPRATPFTSSIVCYYNESEKSTFIEISDCNSKIRIHPLTNNLDFIKKIDILISDLIAYQDFLKTLKSEEVKNDS